MRCGPFLLLLIHIFSFYYSNAQQDGPSGPAMFSGGSFILHKFQQKLGKESFSAERINGGYRYSVDYRLVDRGQAVPLKAMIAVTPAGEPLAFAVKGSTSRMSTINDTVSVKEHAYRVRVDDSAYSLPLSDNSFPIGGFSPGTAQMLLLQYWRHHGQPRIIHTVPGGDIGVRAAGKDSIVHEGRVISLHRYVISGLIWGNELIWADESGQMYCLITNDAEGDKLEMVWEPYEELLPHFISKAAVYGMQLFDDLTGAGRIRSERMAIVNAKVLDVQDSKYLPGRTILIENGKITDIVTGRPSSLKGFKVVDAKGQTVMPGLWDMHAHFQQAEWGPAYLAAGITTVRDCGNEFDYINAVQRAIDGGQGIGPRILRAGIIDGTGPMALGVIQAATPEDAVKWVRMYKDSGFDQIKVYSSLKPAVLKAICDEAHRLGLTVTGHVPNGMSLFEGVEAGMDMVSHEPFVNSLLKPGKGDSIDYSDPAAAKVIDFIATRHVVIDPTLGVYEWVFRSLSDPVTDMEPAFYSIPPPLQALFVNTGMPAEQAEKYRTRMERMERQVAVMYQKGVTIVAGTDMDIPGYSLYRELELYVKGGLTPQQALLTATIIPARTMKRDSRSGSLEKGKDADLVILDGDPLVRIGDLRKIKTVVKGDQIYDCAVLHKMAGFQ